MDFDRFADLVTPSASDSCAIFLETTRGFGSGESRAWIADTTGGVELFTGLIVTEKMIGQSRPPKRAVGRRLQEYEDTLSFIRDLAAARTSPSANLQLLFL